MNNHPSSSERVIRAIVREFLISPSELAQLLCEMIERFPACEQQTRVSIMASELRREVDTLEQTAPLSERDEQRIEQAVEKYRAALAREIDEEATTP